jgi:hypothetical protein
VKENVEYVTRGGDKGLPAVLSARPSSSTKPIIVLHPFGVMVWLAKIKPYAMGRKAIDFKKIMRQLLISSYF